MIGVRDQPGSLWIGDGTQTFPSVADPTGGDLDALPDATTTGADDGTERALLEGGIA